MAKPWMDPSLLNETELFMKMKVEEKVVCTATHIANIVKHNRNQSRTDLFRRNESIIKLIAGCIYSCTYNLLTYKAMRN